MRVAVVGLGAIGHHIAQVLEGRGELVRVDRTRAPLRDGEPPVDALIVTTKTPGTAWAADVAARLLGPEGVALTIQNGLGNHEILAAKLGAQRVALGVIYIGAGWRAIAGAMDGHRSSMHADVAARRPTEIDAINGALAREAERRGLRAPLNQALCVLVSALLR